MFEADLWTLRVQAVRGSRSRPAAGLIAEEYLANEGAQALTTGRFLECRGLIFSEPHENSHARPPPYACRP